VSEEPLGHGSWAPQRVARCAVRGPLLALALVACDGREPVATLPVSTPLVAHEPPRPAPRGPSADESTDVIGDLEVAGWARLAGVPPRRVQLEQIAVYGADGGSERPAAERAVRVVLRFDGVAVYRRGELPAEGALPRRLVLDLDGVALGPGVRPALPVGAGGLERVRAFVLDQDRMRVSFDVGPNTAHRLFFLSDPYRVVMDFQTETRSPAKARVAKRGFRIVLDPGHGGDQPGAKSPNGLRESTVALSIARKVRRELGRRLADAHVVMTREDGRFVSLEERAAIANAVDADLFVSIHLDASPSADDPGGVSAYVLDTTDDQAALRLAARENGTNAEGVTRLQLILASLYRKDQVQRSLALAEQVQRGTLRSGRKLLPALNDRGVQRALFYVLVGARMPAVLLEASFITRKEEAEALATDPYREALAVGIADGIVRYVERVRERTSD
jgi:N-acetylmuramoyl-L-alanine amidase